MCFSVVIPSSFNNVCEKWLPEIKRHREQAPIILVGTQCDLKQDVKVLIDLADHNEQPVSSEAAAKFAHKIGTVYVECSALTQKNLKHVFDTAILAGLRGTHKSTVRENAPKPYDIISWGKYRGKEMKKLLGNLTKDVTRDQLDCCTPSTERKAHSKSDDVATKTSRWKKFICWFG